MEKTGKESYRSLSSLIIIAARPKDGTIQGIVWKKVPITIDVV